MKKKNNFSEVSEKKINNSSGVLNKKKEDLELFFEQVSKIPSRKIQSLMKDLKKIIKKEEKLEENEKFFKKRRNYSYRNCYYDG